MKQGYNDRLDESLGMRRGPERDMKQSYKDRRDESRGMKDYASKANEKYLPKGMNGIMGHEKAPKSCNPPVGQGWKEVKPMKQGMKGYSKEAFDYKY